MLSKQKQLRKPTRSASGIVPVAVMLPPRKCSHGTCLYCPSLEVPQSYTPKSPVVLRAAEVGYNAYEQVKARLKAFSAMKHNTEKVELIIMGGTFLSYPKEFQYKFIKDCYDALNNKKSKTLEQAKKLNEKARHRCIALCIETRPDVCIEYINRMREFGCTRVELGVQMPSDDLYKKTKRGHKLKDVVQATKSLRNAGFKIGYHIMPGLPGSDFKRDLKLFKKLFSDETFCPDQLKLYPCQVIKGAELEKLYWKEKYMPYTKEQTEKILMEMIKLVPRYCRVMRVMREIPSEYLVAGTLRIDLRKDIEKSLRDDKKNISEIRFREIGFAVLRQEKINTNLTLRTTKYRASNGDEYFLEIVNKDDILFGLLRLRIFDSLPAHSDSQINRKLLIKKDNLIMPQQNSDLSLSNYRKFRAKRDKVAIIRELHVYGKAVKLGEKGKLGQHRGIGKWLMNEAENITKKQGIKKLHIISGVGVRDYYKKLGYKLEGEGEYMVKILN